MRFCLWPAFNAVLSLAFVGIVENVIIRGVSPADQSRYEGPTFTCSDRSLELSSAAVNDDFCDCPDGSDEPGTGACAGTGSETARPWFYCPNSRSAPRYLYASRVGDGHCDCCDGSDEWQHGTCKDNCEEEGLKHRQWLETMKQSAQKGIAKRRQVLQEREDAIESSRVRLPMLRSSLPELEANIEARKRTLERLESVVRNQHDEARLKAVVESKTEEPAVSEYAKWMEKDEATSGSKDLSSAAIACEADDIVVVGAGGRGAVVNGKYSCIEKVNGRPKYRLREGVDHPLPANAHDRPIVYFQDATWRIHFKDSHNGWIYSHLDSQAVSPPHGQWTLEGYKGLNNAGSDDAKPAPSVHSAKEWFVSDGKWTKGSISGLTLTWNNGKTSTIEILRPGVLKWKTAKAEYIAVLKEDGKLHWSDGDVWSRTTVVGVSPSQLEKPPLGYAFHKGCNHYANAGKISEGENWCGQGSTCGIQGGVGKTLTECASTCNDTPLCVAVAFKYDVDRQKTVCKICSQAFLDKTKDQPDHGIWIKQANTAANKAKNDDDEEGPAVSEYAKWMEKEAGKELGVDDGTIEHAQRWENCKDVEYVQVWSGALVDRIEFVYRDGSKHVVGSSNGGDEQEPFFLEAGEFLSAVRGGQGGLLDSIQFISSRGRISKSFGGNGGVRFAVSAVAGKKIVGLVKEGKLTAIEECDGEDLRTPEMKERDAAKDAFDMAARELTKAKDEIRDMEVKSTGDFSDPKAVYSLFPEKCGRASFGQYGYDICLYGDAKQGHTVLGRWKGWHPTATHIAEFERGDRCFSGITRTLKATVRCGEDVKIVKVSEPSQCVYEATMLHPAACDEAAYEADANLKTIMPNDAHHDEL